MDQAAAADGSAIRPFQIHVSDAALVDLRQRVQATRWPDKETVSDESQGIRLAEMQALVRYWGNGYDWRKGEAKLNALPEFVTTIDGMDIPVSYTHLLIRCVKCEWPDRIVPNAAFTRRRKQPAEIGRGNGLGKAG